IMSQAPPMLLVQVTRLLPLEQTRPSLPQAALQLQFRRTQKANKVLQKEPKLPSTSRCQVWTFDKVFPEKLGKSKLTCKNFVKCPDLTPWRGDTIASGAVSHFKGSVIHW